MRFLIISREYLCRKRLFVGLKFIILALSDPELLTVLRNTLVLSFLSLICQPLPVIFAILVSEIPSRGYRKFVQTVTHAAELHKLGTGLFHIFHILLFGRHSKYGFAEF